MSNNQTYVALLRGINVGGYHKVPMADLRSEMKALGFKNVQTLLNSGNVIFDASAMPETDLEKKIAEHLETIFAFSIPVLIRKKEKILGLTDVAPFENIDVAEDIRLYISFLKNEPESSVNLPWVSEDASFRIIDLRDKTVCSMLDLSATNTPKGMEALERLFGKDITTRNWNTVNRIAKKLR